MQTAFFVLAAWAYPRLRPGARATLAIWVGLFIAVMGLGEAGYYTRENGPSGDDYTGLLVIPPASSSSASALSPSGDRERAVASFAAS